MMPRAKITKMMYVRLGDFSIGGLIEITVKDSPKLRKTKRP